MGARVTGEQELPSPIGVRSERHVRWGAATVLLAGLLACAPDRRAGEPPRHLVLVTVDTLRADRLSAWRAPRATSDLAGLVTARGGIPAGRKSLDELAAEGVVFARAFAPRSQTFPSMATLFTARPVPEHGCFDNEEVLCTEVATLAEVLGEAGFATAAFTTNKLLVSGSGIEQGFDHFFADFSEERDVRAVAAATQWLRERDLQAGAPMFLWVHLMGPHLPYAPPPLEGVDYATLFTEPGYAGSADGSREFLDEAYRTGRELAPADVEHVRALYDGEIARVDHVLSLFVEVLSGALPEQPVDVLSRSILAVVADHGEELAQRHGYWAHSKSVYDSGLHVPFFVRHPASLTGRRVFGEIVGLEDFMPTVLDWLDVAAPGDLRGRSLLPLLDGGRWARRDAFASWSDRIFTVRTERWRLVLNPERIEPDDPPKGPYPIPEVGLYDVVADPLERHDVAREHPDVVRELSGRIATWLEGSERVCAAGAPVSQQRLDDLRDMGYLDSGEGEAEDR